MITVKRTLHFSCGDKGRQQINKEAPVEKPVEEGRVPRISRLMALAIHCDELIRDGVVTDQSELARLLHVTQPRMTQIMNLLLLAPDIQEDLLFLPRVEHGKDPVHEKMLRTVVAEVDWGRQREAWAAKYPNG